MYPVRDKKRNALSNTWIQQHHIPEVIMQTLYKTIRGVSCVPMERSTVVILDSIRSAENVGAILRTSDGAGVDRVILLGYTPAPIDRFGRKRTDVHKAALGAEESVPWEIQEETEGALRALIHEGYTLVAVEQVAGALPYTEAPQHKRVAYIFGNEIEGVQNDILEQAHESIHIPMHGKKESLNVSVAAGIILFHRASTPRHQ